MKTILHIPVAGALVCSVFGAAAQQGDGTHADIQSTVFKPAIRGDAPHFLNDLMTPPGFSVSIFATGLKNARMLASSPNGDVYLSRRDEGDVLLLRDADQDGRADLPISVVATRPGVHGLAVHDGKLYMAAVREVYVADILPDGRLGPPRMIINDLPDGGQHPNRTLAFGPDGMMYLSIGSSCNACNETNPEHATMLRVSPDGKRRSIWATGLRNTIGFGFEPVTGELWGMDHGMDFLGHDNPPEELNRIERGKRYGWPHVWGTDGVNPQSTPRGGISKPQWSAMSTPMAMGYTAHAAPMQMVFYTGTAFPASYQGDAFVAMRGSWNRDPASGYEIARIHFQDGQPQRIVPFVIGFLAPDGKTHTARPTGLAVAADGALLMSDDANGTIYRISYTGPASALAAAAMPPPPADSLLAQARRGNGVALVSERPDIAGLPSLRVSSPSVSEARLMPSRHSAYEDNVSPEIQWSAVPGARSYVVVMEDPDSQSAMPSVHWVAYNIPGDVTRLPEGLQVYERLTEPEGMLQGVTSRGSPGYYGPKPPSADAPHRYYFQVLALNTVLSVQPGATRDEVLSAAQGHIIARGRLMGRYQQR